MNISIEGNFVVKIVYLKPETDPTNKRELAINNQNTDYEPTIEYNNLSMFEIELDILKHLNVFKYEGNAIISIVGNEEQFTFDTDQIALFDESPQLQVTKLLYGTFENNKGYLIMPKYYDFYDEFKRSQNLIKPAGYYSLFLELAEAIK